MILQRRFEDTINNRESDVEFNQSVWDEWNAKLPSAQTTDVLAADAALLSRFESLADKQRAEFNFAMGPMIFDFAGFVGLRLNEHALHTWDVAVALNDAAVIPADVTEVVIDGLGFVARFSGKPTGIEHTVNVRTSDPVRNFRIVLTADSLEMTEEVFLVEPDLEIPAEAFIRLVYGRLDADHSPVVSQVSLLDELRRAFPGI